MTNLFNGESTFPNERKNNDKSDTKPKLNEPNKKIPLTICLFFVSIIWMDVVFMVSYHKDSKNTNKRIKKFYT